MRVRLIAKPPTRSSADLVVCFAHEGDTAPRGVPDRAVWKALGVRMKAEHFEGLPGDRLLWNVESGKRSDRYLVMGLGRADGSPGEALRQGCARAARAAARLSATDVTVLLPVEGGGKVSSEDVRAAVEGVRFGAYEFDRHLTDARRKSARLRSVDLVAAGAPTAAPTAAEATARAIGLARDLVNEAPSRMTPSVMAREAQREARAAGLQCRVLGPPELRKINMPALLAVSRGSAEPPRVVHLTYKPKGRVRALRRVVLVGKGVTFDSGGLNLKPGDSMLTMKSDMAGAAAVLAAMTALREVGCRAEVHGLLGLVENMTGASAYKPGDILNTYLGKTVEVGNTDAEGRLVLCDVLAWAADKLDPGVVVDLATLTGACVVALGTRASGLFTRHDELRDELLAAGKSAGEKLWPLPMYDEYLAMLQKGPADLRNVGERWGGATTAALFLGEFVPRELPWAHLDIAGPAFAESESAECPAGATGAGVATLLRWLETL